MPFDIQASDNNIKRLSELDRLDLIKQVCDEFQNSEEVLGEWKGRIVKYYDLYQLVQRKKNYEGLSNIFVPEILRAVETVTAKLYQMIFAQPNWFEYSGRDNNGDDGNALALTQLVRYQIEENNFKAKVMDCLRQMVIAGLTVRKIGWDYEEVQRYTGRKDGVYQRQIETCKDTWTFEPVDLLSFHISDITVPYNNVQKAAWIGEEFRITRQLLREKCRRGWFSRHELEELDRPLDATTTNAQNLKDNRLTSSGFVNKPKKEEIQIFERWGLLPAKYVMSPEERKQEGYEDEDMVEAIIVLGNKKAILKLERNMWFHQQKPYVVCPYIPKEFELPGIGIAQVSETLQEEINDTRNQVMDNKTLILACMWLKSRGAQINDKDLVIKANGVIKTNDMAGLEALRPPLVTGVGQSVEAIAKNDLREGSGAASNLQGIAQSGVGTATEAATINKESLSRLVMVAQMFAELVLKPTLKMAEFLNYQYYDHVKVISIIGPVGVKYKQLAPDEIRGGLKDVSIKVALDATENPAIQRQQMMNFLTIVQPMQPQQIAFHWKLLNKIFGMFFNGHDLSELYPQPMIEPEKLLTPEEERDCILAGQPVLAEDGQNHEQYIQFHEQELADMALSLDPLQLEMYKKLILSHWQKLMQQIQMQQQQMMAQQMGAMGQEQPGKTPRGQTPGATPFTQGDAPSTKNLGQGLGA